ncbi:hypothetical protein B0F90DRAFT_887747 [Multifurca ochricompacta]|uniref:DUF6534 domain-containing protein n=1 Tax=Multifurca ochricompacta TaxID=376703 RepID=A0AAD4M210_9AGAM|nr:hypothetical protein B0F90DRAFT_887747 [Multifurca ochricompacta]
MSTFLDSLLGAFLIGVILSSIIYGITWLQVYLYYSQHCSRDGVFLKSFVAMLTVLDTVHLVLLCHGLYAAAVTNFGNYLANLHAPWTLVVQCIVGVAATTCIQQFYALRVYQLSQRKNIIIPIAISTISVTEFGFSVAFATRSLEIGSFAKNTPSLPYGVSTLALEVICGAFITVSMVYYILQQRSGIRRTNRVLKLVTLYIINSGALNLVFATTCLITYVHYPKTLIYAPFFFILIRLYPCSFMTILNSRVNVRSRLRGEGPTIVTITHEQITDRSPLTSSKPGHDSSGDAMAMASKARERRTAEKAVGLDEGVI